MRIIFASGGGDCELRAACYGFAYVSSGLRYASSAKKSEQRLTRLCSRLADWRSEDSQQFRQCCLGAPHSVRTASELRKRRSRGRRQISAACCSHAYARRGATKRARTVRDSSAKRASSARRAATTETVVRNAPAARDTEQLPNPWPPPHRRNARPPRPRPSVKATALSAFLEIGSSISPRRFLG